MTRQRRAALWIVALGSALAVAAIVLLPLLRGGEDGDVVAAAAGSSVGRFALVLMALGVATLAGLCALLARRAPKTPRRPLYRVFIDEGGTAGVEMLLALPVMLMISFLILQGILIWHGNMVFHYATYATARAAASIIPAHVTPAANELPFHTEATYRMSNDLDDGRVQAGVPSYKRLRIRRNAVMALVPISGRFENDSLMVDEYYRGEDLLALIRGALERGDADRQDPAWIERVVEQYNYADALLVMSISYPWHWEHGGEELAHGCPFQASRREWGTNDWNTIYYCPYEPVGVIDYAPWEQITIALQYPFEMDVPWAAKIIYELLRQDDRAYELMVPGTGRTIYVVRFYGEIETGLSG